MNYTTIEQSKHLLALGLKPETADMFYLDNSKARVPILGEYKTFDIPSIKRININELIPIDMQIPCWSIGSLLELLREYNDCNKLDIFSNRSQKWQITISYYDVVWKEHEEININLLEAAYNTVVWLLKNEYIKNDKK